MELPIKRLSPAAVLPQYATAGSAGLDLRACVDAPVPLPPGGSALVPTGLAAAIPQGFVGLVFARSGLAIKSGISLSNGVGVIDSDYRGEIKVGLVNLGQGAYTLQPGDRVAQMVLVPFVQPNLVEVESLPDTQRGTGGFGSTGRS